MTATHTEFDQANVEPSAPGVPGLAQLSGVNTAHGKGSDPAPSEESSITPSGSRARERLIPALNLQPVLLKGIRQWALVLAMAVWVIMTATVREMVVPAVGLLFAVGVGRSLIEHRIQRGAISHPAGMTVANFALLLAVSFAGFAGATLVSPVVMVIPALVWSIAAVAPKQWMVDWSSRVAVLVTAGLAVMSASRFAEAPTTTSGSIALGGAAIVAIVVAALHGRQAGWQLLRNTGAGTEEGAVETGNHALAGIRRAIAAQSDPTGIATTAVRAVNESFSPAYVAVVELVPHGNMFSPLAEIVNDVNTIDLGRRLAGVTESALSKGTPLWMLDDADDTFTLTCRRLGIQAALIVPLEHLSHRIGAIQIAWSEVLGPVELAEALSYTTELGNIITPDLAIAQFASEIERGYFDAITSLAARVDDREEFTRGHSRRVARHALTIAEALDLDDEQQRKLIYAAELHDIGRIGVSDEILSKPGQLSAQEWAQVRAYPRISADIVEPLSFFTDVREIVLHQNERWDGKGYPDQLAGIQIPLLSRILAVADAFDAMTSPRAYRSAMTAQEALSELWKARGAKFDPDVVEAFVMSGSIRQKTA